jgi:hypothetical protein
MTERSRTVSGDAIAAPEQPLGHDAAEAAAHPVTSQVLWGICRFSFRL